MEILQAREISKINYQRKFEEEKKKINFDHKKDNEINKSD